MKTDINGYKKWIKFFGDPGISSKFGNSALTFDGGMVLIGNTKEYYNKINPLIVKVNACGEKEWCRIYLSTNPPEAFGNNLVTVPTGGYMAEIIQWKNYSDLWLFRLDSLGYIIWQQQYATDPNIFLDPLGRGLLRTSDSCYFITGEAYSPDSLYPGYTVVKIFSIKVKLDGVALFQTPWGNNNGIISDYDYSSIEDPGHCFLTVGRRARSSPPYGDSPCLFKTSSSGQPVFYHDLITNCNAGGCNTITRFQDSTLAIAAGWYYPNYVDSIGLIKTSSNGNVLKTKPIIVNDQNAVFWGAERTFNNRVIVAGMVTNSGTINACAAKLTSNLEYDSIYTKSYIYDSLCPYPIVSDTIPLNDCSVVVSVFNPSKDLPKTKVVIYPNPAKNAITIEMPQYLTRQSSGYGITATTYYHQWNTTTLEIYDLFGKLMYSKEIPKKTEKVELDVNSWHAGMYVARVVFMNEVVAGSKFVIQR